MALHMSKDKLCLHLRIINTLLQLKVPEILLQALKFVKLICVDVA